jgi:alanyl-tRNA synthetase
MTTNEIRQKYLEFFEKKGHKIIPSASLVPENDPSTLFISAGMQPLVPYLLGEIHPQGTRLVNSQKCIRTGDIDDVGDTSHHTFFEMLGNWSLGDYFKESSIPWSYEFLTKDLNISPDRLSITVFAGDADAPKDTEAAELWKELGIPEERIYYFGKEDNWWAAGATGPCGPDTEIFYDVTQKPHGPDCRPGDGCGRYFEIWNNVFMVYNRKENGSLEELPKKNVDTGMGLDRTATVLAGLTDNYQNDLFKPALERLLKIRKIELNYDESPKPFRIILDHLRAAVFAVSDGVIPSNKERGYILRRLIRRAIVQSKKLGLEGHEWILEILSTLVQPYSEAYPEVIGNIEKISKEIILEVDKFEKTLDKGLKEVEKIEKIDGKIAFDLYQTYGFPLELTIELFAEKGQTIDEEQFKAEFVKHQDLSRTQSAGTFKGGLMDHSDETTRLHTATHLLHKALREVLGEHVQQKGSNITHERLRFDFVHDQKLTEEQKHQIENLVNQEIDKDLPVSFKTESLEEAKAEGALAFFGERYAEQVKVYSIGEFSKEVCGGPHVSHLSELGGHVTITKEESLGAGVRRIYAVITA